MRQNILLVALSALTVATAQSQNFTIDAGKIDPGLKGEWCNAQYNTCNKLCDFTATANECKTDTLAFTCTCGNGTAPGLEYYTQTMPTFICEQAFSDCIEANTGSSRGQDECKSNIKSHCGTLDPTKADTSNSGSSSKSSSSASRNQPTQAPTTSQNVQNAPATTTASHGAAATNAALIGKGVAVVAAGVFAAML